MAQPTRLRLLRQTELPPNLAQLPLLFGFELRDVLTDEALPEFAVPATLMWRNEHLARPREAQLWQVDPATLVMTAAPSFAPVEGGVAAALTAAGIYASSMPSAQNQFVLPDIQAGQMDTFTGDASYSYSFDMPAGAGGMSLPVTLRYSAGASNSAGEKTTSDGGWVGAGWTLNLGEIITTKWDEKGSLSLDSLSSKLVQDPNVTRTYGELTEPDLPTGCKFMGDPNLSIGSGWTDATWRAQNEQFAKLTSHRFASNMNGKDPGSTPQCGATSALLMAGQWDLWTKSGLHYVFGSAPVSITAQPCGQPESGSGSRLAYWLDNYHTRRYSVYKLDTVLDTHGNRIQIEYDVNIRREGCDLRMHKEAYPKRILYTTNPDTGDNHAEYEVTFAIEAKDVDPKVDTPMAETGWLLKRIEVWYRATSGATAKLIRRYDLTYDNYNPPDPHMYLLKSIQQFGSDGASALPATTFTYYFDDAHKVGWKSNSSFEACGSDHQEKRPFLATINNGYDGQVRFDYTVQCLPDGYTGCAGTDVGDGMLQKVLRRTVTAGIGPAQVTEYQHSSPSYERVTECSYEDLTRLKEFIGYGRVVEDAKATDGQVLRRTQTQFHNAWDATAGNGKPDDPLRGRPYETITGGWSNSAWQTRTQVETTWSALKVAGGGAWPGDVNFVYQAEVKTTEVAADGSSWDRKVKNYYDPSWQDACGGGGQYGNLTRVEEYGQASSATPFRTTVIGYCPNTTAWILDRPAVKNVYAGSGPTQPGGTGGTLLTSTWHIYDDDMANPSPNWQRAAGSKGELRGTRQWAFTDTAARYVDTRNWYDAWGNLIDAVEFADYGTAGAWAQTRLAKMHYDYDSTHHSFMLTAQREAKSGVTPPNQTTHYEYFGVNDVAFGAGLPGQLRRTQAPNGAWTEQTYDVFGRLLRQWQPYDSEAMPTVSYQYLDAYAGPTTAVRMVEWEVPGVAGANRPTVTFYDGLGRVVQTKVESANGSEMVITDQTYDELGRPRYQYAPYKESSATNFYEYRPENTVQPKTSYTHDALDRVLSVTQPDTKVTTTLYKICYNAADNDFKFPRLCQEVTDANSHKVRYASDAFGRLRSVTQWNGSTEARSRYEYDEADRLLSAEDPGGAKATLTYDQLGRKLTMSDPDMGGWQYRYDPLSNLVAQRDAKNQATCLLYDAFSRLIGKNYTSNVTDINAFSCTARRDVGYSYDNGTNGVGQRTSMSNTASIEVWSYDQRGRLIGETKTITGTGTFVSSWWYDSLNRVTWQQYPGGNGGQVDEQVNYTYGNNGLLRTVIGASTYVTETLYDALGHVTLRNLGLTAAVGQRYTYPSAKNYRLGTLTSGVGPNYNTLQNVTYTYDNVGNVVTIADAAANGGAQTFTYDSLDRLATAAASGGYGPYTQQTYGYTANGNLTRFNSASANQAYNDAAHKHAVTHVGGTQKYWYDANGNVTKRIGEDGATYEFVYDFENRVTALKKNGVVISAFKYDGDGNRIVETTGGVTTAYIGNYYEWTASGAKLYYYAGNVRVALRDSAGVRYLLGDHLGSTALTTDSNGARQTELRYYPYGKTRYTYGTTPTTYRFTGQRQQANTNELYFYQSRWYDPLVGRFLSADTIVPDPKNPQGLNRYSYVSNNPLRYVDPTGHAQVCDAGDEGGGCGYGGLDPHALLLRTASGVYIDTSHFKTAMLNGRDVLDQIRMEGIVEITRLSTIKVGSIQVQAGINATYEVGDVSPELQKQVALGILEDSSIMFENTQWSPPSNHSHFSGEDLSSDYLGFVAGLEGLRLGDILETLGPPKTAGKPSAMPRNSTFEPIVQDNSGNWDHRQWPEALTITPAPSSAGVWERTMLLPALRMKQIN